MTATHQSSGPDWTSTRTWPPRGVYLMALETRLPKICWQSEASVTTRDSGSSADVSQPSPAACAGSRNCRSISRTIAPTENVPSEGRGAAGQSGIVKIAAGEAEQVVAERDHGQQMSALIDGHGSGRVSEQEIEARAK